MGFRVAIVNDLAMAREALRRVVLAIPGTSVAWTANDGLEALQRAKADRPDLVLMDLIMPVMDGVECTRRIMAEAPCPIVVVTATVEGNASRVYEAIGAGALDAVETPRLGPTGAQGDRALVEKVNSVRRMRTEDVMAPRAAAAPTPAPSPVARAAEAVAQERSGSAPILAIGASTGGPQALATLIGTLPAPAPFSIIVVQHMDANFLPGMATWLGSQTERPVRLARAGDRPEAGTALIAGEPRQMVLSAQGAVEYVEGDPGAIHRPSVNALFHSLAQCRSAPGFAVLLTGMGKDGAEGMLAMRSAGWHTVAQDQATSVVWGMPGAASQLGAAQQVLPLREIGPALVQAAAARRAGGTR
jgi:two-component system response regulator WspF